MPELAAAMCKVFRGQVKFDASQKANTVGMCDTHERMDGCRNQLREGESPEIQLSAGRLTVRQGSSGKRRYSVSRLSGSSRIIPIPV